MNVPEKRKLTEEDKHKIMSLHKGGMTIAAIAQSLGIHGQQVAGYVRTTVNFGFQRPPSLPPSMPMSAPPLLPPPTKDDELQALAKRWKNSDPDAEFSLLTAKDKRIYIASYREGIVLRIGDVKKVALLTPSMARRFGMKICEMAEWVRV